MRRLIPFRKAASSAKRKRQTRRRVTPRWLRPVLYVLGTITVFAGVGGGGYWAWNSGAAARLSTTVGAAMVDLSVRADLKIDDILVEGRTEVTKAQVLDAVGVRRGAPILGVDANAIRARLMKLGWVADATVERRLPGTLYIRLRERRAMAIWQRNGRFVLVDRGGVVIGSQGLDRYGHLKIVIGAAAPRHTPALLDMMATAPKLMARVRAAIWVGDRRWNLRLDNGIDIRLPEKDPQAAWAWLVALERDRQLLSHGITAIDLRIRSRLVVQRRDQGERT
jgi:cell division protein FtsQ